jgi:hypothetical protein
MNGGGTLYESRKAASASAKTGRLSHRATGAGNSSSDPKMVPAADQSGASARESYRLARRPSATANRAPPTRRCFRPGP